MNDLVKMGQQLKARRKEKGWTQAHVAELCGLDRTTIGLIERADYNDIGIRKVNRVVELLGYKFSLNPRFLPTLDDLVAEQREEEIKNLTNSKKLIRD